MAFLMRVKTLYTHSKLVLKNHSCDTVLGRIWERQFGKSSMLCSDQTRTTNVNSSEINKKLMEFFDDSKNWGEDEVRVGRAWCKDELRIKSNSDLHKLWFVLLKEKNMLLSMEHESNERMRLFPSPERLDKVQESMNNLEEVVRERNRAYYMLETGEDGERPGRLAINRLGYRFFYKMKEYAVPYQRNLRWWRRLPIGYENSASVNSFLRLYREQLYLSKKKLRTRNLNHVQHLLRRFPHLDLEAIRRRYPEVDIEKARSQRRADGSHEFNS
ncbi:39S ribosomal protein L47, mitochondrial [Ischnura elegans]|uniref:39S ribosomal protein L47, mitochondrial n=1 Tax=Ischnura elegans TaxID=197161 RepID=UPI001ED874E9|nr:39S ribosomal protein L47, mitochondrial [Ischnura elegans]